MNCLKVINNNNYKKQNINLPLFFKKSIIDVNFNEDYFINTKETLKIIILTNNNINITMD